MVWSPGLQTKVMFDTCRPSSSFCSSLGHKLENLLDFIRLSMRHIITAGKTYFDLSLSFILCSHSLCPTTLFSSRTSTREESLISIISTSSLKSSITLSDLRLASLVASQVSFPRQIRYDGCSDHVRSSLWRSPIRGLYFGAHSL